MMIHFFGRMLSEGALRRERIRCVMTAEKELGLRVREQRKRLLLTQDELAEKAGLSVQHVGDIERGQANPTFSCLCKLAEVMGMDVSAFFVTREEQNLDTVAMRSILMEFMKTAKKKHLEIFYTLYRGML